MPEQYATAQLAAEAFIKLVKTCRTANRAMHLRPSDLIRVDVEPGKLTLTGRDGAWEAVQPVANIGIWTGYASITLAHLGQLAKFAAESKRYMLRLSICTPEAEVVGPGVTVDSDRKRITLAAVNQEGTILTEAEVVVPKLLRDRNTNVTVAPARFSEPSDNGFAETFDADFLDVAATVYPFVSNDIARPALTVAYLASKRVPVPGKNRKAAYRYDWFLWATDSYRLARVDVPGNHPDWTCTFGKYSSDDGRGIGVPLPIGLMLAFPTTKVTVAVYTRRDPFYVKEVKNKLTFVTYVEVGDVQVRMKLADYMHESQQFSFHNLYANPTVKPHKTWQVDRDLLVRNAKAAEQVSDFERAVPVVFTADGSFRHHHNHASIQLTRSEPGIVTGDEQFPAAFNIDFMRQVLERFPAGSKVDVTGKIPLDPWLFSLPGHGFSAVLMPVRVS
jgi:hypothetical protein